MHWATLHRLHCMQSVYIAPQWVAHVQCWLALLDNLEAKNNRGLYDRALLTNLAAIADHDRPNWRGYYLGKDLGDRIRALPAWDDPQPNEG